MSKRYVNTETLIITKTQEISIIVREIPNDVDAVSPRQSFEQKILKLVKLFKSIYQHWGS